MNRIAIRLVLGLAVTASVAAHSSRVVAETPAAGVQACSPNFDPVRAHVSYILANYPVAGCGLRVTQDGAVLLEEAYGQFQVDQVVLTASAVKWASAVVIMSLVDDGTLTLEDTTGQWLGWTGVHGTITVRQLFAHTSGITTVDAPCLSDGQTTLAACAAQIGQFPLVAVPGTQFRYAGNSMQVAGRVCEVASGRSFVQLFNERVRAPLGLSSTGFLSATNPRVPGGAVTTLRDFGRITQMWGQSGVYDGRQVLSAAAVETALADQTNGVPAISLPPGAQGPFLGYGIGNWVWRLAPDDTVLESSSPGAFGFTPWVDRERALTGVFAVQYQNFILSPEVEELRRLVRVAVDGACRGDMNCDGVVSVGDIGGFVMALTDPAGYAVQFPQCDIGHADLDGNGQISVGDIGQFVGLLTQ